MNHKNRFFNVNKVDHLEIPTRTSLSPNQPLFIVYFHWKWAPRMVDDVFGFLGLNIVLANLVAIPVDPTEFMGHS
jgi:hypothetical protein